jgi:hypothetical protein
MVEVKHLINQSRSPSAGRANARPEALKNARICTVPKIKTKIPKGCKGGKQERQKQLFRATAMTVYGTFLTHR